jgi:hypothetical protein
MSTFIAYILPQGMIFAADRNVTVRCLGESPRQECSEKIVAWPSGRGLLGYVGTGSIRGQDTQALLRDFIAGHADLTDVSRVAHNLRDFLEAEMTSGGSPKDLIVQFGTFANRGGTIIPEFWHITNIHSMDERTGKYGAPTETFECSERILGHHLKSVEAAKLRAHLRTVAEGYRPFWFHQSIDLAVFNLLGEGSKAAVRVLQDAKLVPKPLTLADWEKHARFWILLFEAYFQAFERPNEQYVGGDVDVLSIAWPET